MKPTQEVTNTLNAAYDTPQARFIALQNLAMRTATELEREQDLVKGLEGNLKACESENTDLKQQVEELKVEAKKILGSPTLRVAAEMAAARNQEIAQLRAQLTEAGKDKERLIFHLGNMLDEVLTTKRGEWPRHLYCIECGCNVSKSEQHKQNCKVGAANNEYDAAIEAQKKMKHRMLVHNTRPMQ